MIGVHPGNELLPPYNLWAAAGFTVPLLAIMAIMTELPDEVPELSEIRSLLQKTIIPIVSEGPFWVGLLR